MNDEQIYYKHGRCYYPAHTTMHHWFPAAGVWLVEYGPRGEGGRQIAPLGDTPDPMRLAALESYRGVLRLVAGGGS